MSWFDMVIDVGIAEVDEVVGNVTVVAGITVVNGDEAKGTFVLEVLIVVPVSFT